MFAAGSDDTVDEDEAENGAEAGRNDAEDDIDEESEEEDDDERADTGRARNLPCSGCERSRGTALSVGLLRSGSWSVTDAAEPDECVSDE